MCPNIEFFLVEKFAKTIVSTSRKRTTATNAELKLKFDERKACIDRLQFGKDNSIN